MPYHVCVTCSLLTHAVPTSNLVEHHEISTQMLLQVWLQTRLPAIFPGVTFRLTAEDPPLNNPRYLARDLSLYLTRPQLQSRNLAK